MQEEGRPWRMRRNPRQYLASTKRNRNTTMGKAQAKHLFDIERGRYCTAYKVLSHGSLSKSPSSQRSSLSPPGFPRVEDGGMTMRAGGL